MENDSAKTIKDQWKVDPLEGVTLNDVQKFHRDAEAVGNFTVFNIKGNKYRLIVSIDYQHQLIYIKYILTHSEYDKEKWKNDPYF
jgi:mRNA interferase HigB